nr:Methyltransferase type 12 [Kibdelosporangium sp. MJ126-NF4]
MSTPYLNLTTAAGKVAAFSTAVRLGLIDRIDREPAGPAELARTCGATERGVRVVLAALAECGFVEQLADGRYRPALTGLAGLHPLIPLWDHLPEAVRTGVPVHEANSSSPGSAIYPRTTAFLGGPWATAVDQVINALPADAARILDVCAGTEPWTIPYCQRNPRSHVTALDIPETLTTTRRAVSRAALTDQYEFLPGDMFTTPLKPCVYNLVIVAQVCSLLNRTEAAALIKRLTPTLSPNGTLAIIDTLADAPGSAMQELSLYLRTREGTIHQPHSYRHWLTAAGLSGLGGAELPTPLAITVITGNKTVPIATDPIGTEHDEPATGED